MFHVTIISDARFPPLRDELRRRGCVVEEIHYSAFPTGLSLLTELVSDVVICFPFPDIHTRLGSLSISSARRLRTELASLSHDVCMADGRKWRAIPFLILVDDRELSAAFFGMRGTSGDVLSYFDDDEAFRLIKATVDGYQSRVISGFDDLGFLIKYENGRFRLGPALGGKRNLENDFYNGYADRTRTSRSNLVTINRDILGVQYEIEQLEFLINRKTTSESDLQVFFEENPHFLASHRQGTPMPHIRFPDSEGKDLIPDFLMKPYAAIMRDSNWEVLDLKLPTAKLLSGKGNRRRFSHEVATAVAQLRDYADYFQNPRNEQTIRQILQHPLRRPKLAVLMGRMPPGGDVEALGTC